MQDKSLEDEMQRLMSGLSFEPEAVVWENIYKELHPEKKRSIAVWWWLAGLLAIIAGGSVLWRQALHQKPAPPAVLAKERNIVPDKVVAPVVAAGGGSNVAEPVKDKPDNAAGTEEQVIQHRGAQTLESVTPAYRVYTGYGTGKADSAMIIFSGAAVTNGTAADTTTQAEKETFTNRYTDVSIELLPDSTTAGALLFPDPFTPAAGKPNADAAKNTADRKWILSPMVGAGVSGIRGGLQQSTDINQLLPEARQGDLVSSSPSTGTGGSSGSATRSLYTLSNRPSHTYRAGFLLEKETTKRLHLQTGLFYQYISFRSDLKMYVINSSNTVIANGGDSQLYYRLHYISVPLLARYRINNWLGVSAGVTGSIALGGNQYGTGFTNIMSRGTMDAVLLWNVVWRRRERNLLSISPYIQYGLNPVYSGAPANRHLIQGGIQFSIPLYVK